MQSKIGTNYIRRGGCRFVLNCFRRGGWKKNITYILGHYLKFKPKVLTIPAIQKNQFPGLNGTIMGTAFSCAMRLRQIG